MEHGLAARATLSLLGRLLRFVSEARYEVQGDSHKPAFLGSPNHSRWQRCKKPYMTNGSGLDEASNCENRQTTK